MIRWPFEAVLTPAAQANLERFKATSAAREFERDPREWTVAEWSWTDEPTMHVVLRDPSLIEIVFIFDETGTWRLQEGQHHFLPEALGTPEDSLEVAQVLEAPRLIDRVRRLLHPSARPAT